MMRMAGVAAALQRAAICFSVVTFPAASVAEESKPPPNDQPASGPAQKSAEALEQENWRKAISQTPHPKSGCWRAEFPNTHWVEVPCTKPKPRPFGNALPQRPFTVGNGTDYQLDSPGSVATATGSFWETDGLTSETDSNGVADSFSLQLNTNVFTSPACSTAANPATCKGWEQFIYSSGDGVFIQFWMLNYGKPCPDGWTSNNAPGTTPGCFRNSDATSVSPRTIAGLLNMAVTGRAVQGGDDTVILTTGTEAFQASAPDGVLNLAGRWKSAEFNIFGDCCSAQANLNAGAQLGVDISVNDGTNLRATCSTTGTTAETNNATLAGPCCPDFQGIQFLERTDGGLGLLCTNDKAVVTAVSPNHGPSSGGTMVTVTGTGFFNSANHGPPLRFGGLRVRADCPSPFRCIATTLPAPIGPVNVTFAGSPTSPGNVFTFNGPTVTRIVPNEGPEDSNISIDLFGTELSSNMEARFGEVSGAMICDDSTHCVVSPPRGTGTVHVVVGATDFSAPTPADLYTYKPFPTGFMRPRNGLPEGGTKVSVHGTKFATAPGATTISFNMNGTSVPAVDVSCSSASDCEMQTPPVNPRPIGFSPAVVPVTVTVAGLTNTIGSFTYQTPLPPDPPPAEFCQECEADGGHCVKVGARFVCKGLLH
jgi:hypothetical protein